MEYKYIWTDFVTNPTDGIFSGTEVPDPTQKNFEISFFKFDVL